MCPEAKKGCGGGNATNCDTLVNRQSVKECR